MKDTVKKAARRQGISQNQLAKRLGISQGRLSQIANGDSAPEELIIKIAVLAGEVPEKVLALHKLEQPLEPAVKSMWERIGGHAAVWFLVATTVIGSQMINFRPILEQAANSILCKIEQSIIRLKSITANN